MRLTLLASTCTLLTLGTPAFADDAPADPATVDLSRTAQYAQYYAPPPPPVYYVPPPRRVYYYTPPPPPWIRPPHLVRPYFGLGGFGTIVAGQSGGVEYLHNGGGVAIFGGLDIGRVVGIEINYNASFHNPVDNCSGANYGWCGANYLAVETLGIDLKLHIPTDSRFVPYGQVGAVLSWIGRQDSPSDATGGGFEVGGGFDVWLNRVVTMGAQGLYKGLFMSDYATYTGTGTYLDMIYVGGNIQFHLY